MPTNESIMAVPITVEQPGQTRQFLVRLIERLDIVIGTRGGDPYVAQSELNKTTSAGLTALEKTILEIITKLFSIDNAATAILVNTILETSLAAIDSAISDLKSPSTITNANTTTETISNPPTQAEVSALASRVTTNASGFNSLLSALRSTEIIAT